MMESTSRVKDQKAMYLPTYSSNLLPGLTLTLQDLPFNSSHDMSRRFPCDLLM